MSDFHEGRAHGRQEVFATLRQQVRILKQMAAQLVRDARPHDTGGEGNDEDWQAGILANALEVLEDYPAHAWDDTYDAAQREDGSIDWDAYSRPPPQPLSAFEQARRAIAQEKGEA